MSGQAGGEGEFAGKIIGGLVNVLIVRPMRWLLGGLWELCGWTLPAR